MLEHWLFDHLKKKLYDIFMGNIKICKKKVDMFCILIKFF